jgi:hypothetical protein
MAAKDTTTPQRAAERSRRQREHAKSLRERTGWRQLVKRVQVEGQLADSRTRIAEQVGASKQRGLLARVKSLRAAEQSKRKREERK